MTTGRHQAPTRRDLWVFALVVALAIVGGSVLIDKDSEADRADTADSRADVAVEQRDTAVAQAKGLGQQITDACTADGGLAAQIADLCARAQRVVDQPEPDRIDTDALASLVTARVLATIPRPRDGRDGATPPCALLPPFCAGTDGTDGEDGSDGRNGQDGADGRGIAATEVRDGRLFITYTDGEQVDAGPVPPGADGRGITRAEVVDCRLIVTYTDGATQDAGQVCDPNPAPLPLLGG